jgi:dihydroorotase
MQMTFDTIIKGGTIVNQDGIGQADIGIKDGKIMGLGDLSQASAEKTISATGLTVLPGVVDSQVHFREPGNEHKEDLETGSRAAVMGGVTSVFEMPNTSPLTTCPDTLADKIKRARHRMFCDFAFYVGGTRENTNDIPDLERLEGSAGIKVFIGSSTGNLLVDDEESLKKILAKITRRAAFHSEDEARLIERKGIRRPGDPSSHPEWRDVTAAMISTKMLVEAAREAGKRIHVLHISTAEEIEYLAHQKDVASVELTPQHLSLSAPEVYEKLGTYAQMNPPLRDARHAKALWHGLQIGVADVLGSDHAPHTIEEKEKPYPESPSGMTGVQTLVPIMLDHVNNGKLSLERFVDLTSHGPNRLFGMATKGRIAVGMDADFTIVDMNQTKTITNDWIESKSQWTPYNGQTVKGWPKGTIIRGHRVMWEDEIIGNAMGEPVKFSEAL